MFKALVDFCSYKIKTFISAHSFHTFSKNQKPQALVQGSYPGSQGTLPCREKTSAGWCLWSQSQPQTDPRHKQLGCPHQKYCQPCPQSKNSFKNILKLSAKSSYMLEQLQVRSKFFIMVPLKLTLKR